MRVSACARVSVFVYVLCVRVCVCVQAHVLVCARQRVCVPDNEAKKVRDGAHSSKRERETDRETERQRETESTLPVIFIRARLRCTAAQRVVSL